MPSIKKRLRSTVSSEKIGERGEFDNSVRKTQQQKCNFLFRNSK
jgi:hypothetical protein